MSLTVVGLWLASLYLGRDIIAASLVVDALPAISAAVTAIVSIISYIWINQRNIYRLSLVSYLLMALTSLTVVATTGHASSPFIALWMLVIVFCGLYGRVGVATVSLMSIGYLAYLIVVPTISTDQIVVFLLAFAVPIGVSYTIWHRKSLHDTEKDRAYTELAHELSQVSNKSEVVINAIADGVVALDSKGIIQLINPAAQQIVGWSQSDAIGLDYRSVLKLVNSQDESVEASNDPVQTTLQTGTNTATDQLTLVTHNGKKLLVSLHISSPSRTSSGAIIVFRDITNQVVEERQQAEFISTASHEMRTPVAAIEGYLGLALNPNTATIDVRARSYLDKAHESAQHLGRLFQDLLDVSRIDDGRLKNNPSVVDVVASARDITNSLMPAAQQKGLILLFKPDVPEHTAQRLTPVFYTLIDNDHFRETLSNLIENAIKYTKAGDVTVDVDGNEEHVIISVKDTGIGIGQEDVPHLFQKFYRIDNTDTREIGGTGLGLYLCRRLVESMNGRIWVESEYGAGSTFFVEFDRLSHEEAMTRLDTQSTAAAAIEAIQTPSTEQATTAPAAPAAPQEAAQPTPEPAAAPAPQPPQPAPQPAQTQPQPPATTAYVAPPQQAAPTYRSVAPEQPAAPPTPVVTPQPPTQVAPPAANYPQPTAAAPTPEAPQQSAVQTNPPQQV